MFWCFRCLAEWTQSWLNGPPQVAENPTWKVVCVKAFQTVWTRFIKPFNGNRSRSVIKMRAWQAWAQVCRWAHFHGWNSFFNLAVSISGPGLILRHMALVAAISIAAAYIFRTWVKWPDVDESVMAKEKLSSWSSGPFDCFQDMPTCCWTCSKAAEIRKSCSSCWSISVIICHDDLKQIEQATWSDPHVY